MRNHIQNVHKQVTFNIRNNKCTRVLDFNKKIQQSNTATENNKTSQAYSNKKHLEAIKMWGKKEKQHNQLQPTQYRPFKALSLKIPKPLHKVDEQNTILSKFSNLQKMMRVY